MEASKGGVDEQNDEQKRCRNEKRRYESCTAPPIAEAVMRSESRIGDRAALEARRRTGTPRRRRDHAPLAKWWRTAQRYLIPNFLWSLILYFRDGALVSFASRVQAGKHVRFGRGTVVKAYSIVQTSGGRVVFGRNCAIGSFNFIAAGGGADLIAGDYVRIGPHVTILATTRNLRRKDALIVEQGHRDKGIRIGSDVLIGAGATLLDGCDVGDGAVVGAGSLVTGDVPPYAVVAGVPAKVISSRR
jgi:acetyltransferase-like isoleucine patch superfamily enzyme